MPKRMSERSRKRPKNQDVSGELPVPPDQAFLNRRRLGALSDFILRRRRPVFEELAKRDSDSGGDHGGTGSN